MSQFYVRRKLFFGVIMVQSKTRIDVQGASKIWIAFGTQIWVGKNLKLIAKWNNVMQVGSIDIGEDNIRFFFLISVTAIQAMNF